MTENIQAFLRDMGQVVTFGATTTYGLIDDIEELLQDNETGARSVAEIYKVTIETGSLLGLAVGSTLSIGGKSYIVRERYRTQDGKLTELYCRDA